MVIITTSGIIIVIITTSGIIIVIITTSDEKFWNFIS